MVLIAMKDEQNKLKAPDARLLGIAHKVNEASEDTKRLIAEFDAMFTSGPGSDSKKSAFDESASGKGDGGDLKKVEDCSPKKLTY